MTCELDVLSSLGLGALILVSCFSAVHFIRFVLWLYGIQGTLKTIRQDNREQWASIYQLIGRIDKLAAPKKGPKK